MFKQCPTVALERGAATESLFRFLSVLSLCLPLAAIADVAVYDFEGNLEDSVGGHHASDAGTPVRFRDGLTGQYLELQENGLLAMPHTLSEAVLGEDGFTVAFRSRMPAGNDTYAVLFAGGTATGEPLWEAPGLRVLRNGSELIVNYADGVTPGAYFWTNSELPLNAVDWNEIQLDLDFELDVLRLQVNEAVWIHPLDPEMRIDRIRQALQAGRMTIGGFDGAGTDNWVDLQQLDMLTFDNTIERPTDAVIEAYQALLGDLEGNAPLDDETRREHVGILQTSLAYVRFEDVEADLFTYTDAYERLNPPLYSDGENRTFEQLPPHAQALQLSQDHVLQTRVVPGQLFTMAGVAFEAHEVAPGPVAPGTPRVDGLQAEVNGSYHRDIASELTDESRVVRPTGAYAVPGRLVTIRVPEAVVDQGLSVIVGAHFRNMDYDYIGEINRFPDISTEFPLDAPEIRVLNPFGGGIYLKVPEGSDAGWFTMTIDNVVEAPYFSWREGRETDVAAWLQVAATSGAPWADFESDKFMITIPTDLVREVANPDEIMARWDAIMDAARSWSGRSLDRPRAEYYSFDTRLVTPAYGAGYPLVIPIDEMRNERAWNPLAVLELRPHATLMHEMGHNHLDPTLDYGSTYGGCHFIEAESVNHMLAMSVNDRVYGMGMEEAFAHSGVVGRFTFDEAAFDWIMSGNFRKNLPMLWDLDAPLEDQNQLHYQPRSWAKFGDIARIFGWEGLASVGRQFYTEGVPQPVGPCPDRRFIVNRDDYIEAASQALGVNMAPLFHFWGIIPSVPVAERLSSLPASPGIRAMIEHYRDNVAPKTRDEYIARHESLAHRMDYQTPRYEHYLATFDQDAADAIQDQFDYLLATYFGTTPTHGRVQINAGMNDAWYNPETAGQGVFVNVFPDSGNLFLGWFTYDVDGRSQGDSVVGDSGHRWLTAVGRYDGNAVFMDASNTRQGAFNRNDDVWRSYYDDIARISLVFESCDRATLSYDLRQVGQRKVIPLRRVVRDNTDLCEALSNRDGALDGADAELPRSINAGLNDAWFDPNTSGQGVFVNVFPDTAQLFIGWFTFDVDGRREGDALLGDPGHRWMTALGPFDGNRATLDVTLTQGGVFNDPTVVSNSAPASHGAVELVFDNCDAATLSYELYDAGLSGDIALQRVVRDNVALCEAIADDTP